MSKGTICLYIYICNENNIVEQDERVFMHRLYETEYVILIYCKALMYIKEAFHIWMAIEVSKVREKIHRRETNQFNYPPYKYASKICKMTKVG